MVTSSAFTLTFLAFSRRFCLFQASYTNSYRHSYTDGGGSFRFPIGLWVEEQQRVMCGCGGFCRFIKFNMCARTLQLSVHSVSSLTPTPVQVLHIDILTTGNDDLSMLALSTDLISIADIVQNSSDMLNARVGKSKC